MKQYNFSPGTFTGLQGCEIELFESVLPGRDGIAVEIGTCDGYATAVILANSSLQLTSIDPMIETPQMRPNVPNKQRLSANIAPWADRHRLITGYSWDVYPTWNEQLTLLFIDGNHEEWAVTKDFNEWTQWLKKGGLLAMHDYKSWDGPTKIIEEQIFAKPNLWRVVGSSGFLVIAERL
jgi:Methyltransferase domain